MNRKLGPLFWIFFILIVLVNLVPYVWTVLTSFKSQNQIFDAGIFPDPFIIDNYVQVILESGFLSNIWNSFVVSGVTSIVCLLIGVPAAYSFARLCFRFRNPLFMLVLFITIFPGIFIISPLFDFLRSIGAIDTYFALILPYVAYFTPLVVWILTGFFRTIHPSIEEVAIMDGCGVFRMIVKIFLPLSIPSILTVGIIAFTLAWNEFLFALIFTSSESARTVPVAISQFQGVHSLDWGQMTAAAVIATIPIVLISVVLQRYIISGLTAGAVKE
ncbi:carbohydrate ABC transporter permease [Salibacterium halotolerans]|uniref:Multiple sugar transport system permease protein n=1 Tax=Salibacterium halotolerans TaxID=1884432 RepID=A0A1I5XL58_9BACI|nr:carbohydrate ABC transporter permease [Salibacterium halotolerans]SFQ32733.1 multiple sugar transport system permease protein [Salibacterium halotolerans]